MEEFDGRIQRDRWAGLPMLRGTLPIMVQRLTLPTASHDFDGAICLVTGALPWIAYVGMQNAAGAPEWVQIATGTP